MKRFTETQKWSDPWFMDLSSKWKLVWQYLLDSCDNAGVWTPNMKLAKFQVGEEFTESEALEVFADRVMVLESGKWHIVRFVEFQYGQLSEACKPHKQVIELLSKHGISPTPKGYPKGIHTLKEKDKDRDKEQDQEKDGPETKCRSNENQMIPNGNHMVFAGEGVDPMIAQSMRVKRPTQKQAMAYGPTIGIPADHAAHWWNKREANDWIKGAGGGGSTPVGSNWQADMAASRGWIAKEMADVKTTTPPPVRRFIEED